MEDRKSRQNRKSQMEEARPKFKNICTPKKPIETDLWGKCKKYEPGKERTEMEE
jgi:hypothetical protein